MFRQAVVRGSRSCVGSSKSLSVSNRLVCRGLATKSKKGKESGGDAKGKKDDVVLPMKLYGLPARYANALYKSAFRAGALGAVEKDLTDFGELVKSNATLKNYLSNPVISRKDKTEDVAKICKGMSDITRAFFGVLAENGRLQEASKVIDSFEQLMKAQRGEVDATVITAAPLASKELKSLQKAITDSYLEAGKTLMLKEKIDESILGGLQLQVGDRFLDLSIQSKINKVKKALESA